MRVHISSGICITILRVIIKHVSYIMLNGFPKSMNVGVRLGNKPSKRRKMGYALVFFYTYAQLASRQSHAGSRRFSPIFFFPWTTHRSHPPSPWSTTAIRHAHEDSQDSSSRSCFTAVNLPNRILPPFQAIQSNQAHSPHTSTQIQSSFGLSYG